VITRRVFLGTLAGGLLAAPLAADAQPRGQVARMGVLGNAPPPQWEAFRERLRQLGWVEGQNLIIESRWMQGRPDRLPELAAELVRLNPDVILALSSSQVEPLKKLTSTIPIVFASHGDPVGLGHVQSLARPGGNITGISHLMSDLNPKMLELLKGAVPKATLIGIMWNPTTPSHVPALKAIKEAAPQLQVQLYMVEARVAEDFEGAFAAMSQERVGAVLVVAAPVTFAQRARLAELALRHRLPTIFLYKQNAEAGGLMSYGPDLIDSFLQSTRYVDKILRGAKPADLPVEQATKFELVINLKTAKALGLTIPQSLLARADQVIE
jgi:putative ABC transport system substrate-binding protein